MRQKPLLYALVVMLLSSTCHAASEDWAEPVAQILKEVPQARQVVQVLAGSAAADINPLEENLKEMGFKLSESDRSNYGSIASMPVSVNAKYLTSGEVIVRDSRLERHRMKDQWWNDPSRSGGCSQDFPCKTGIILHLSGRGPSGPWEADLSLVPDDVPVLGRREYETHDNRYFLVKVLNQYSDAGHIFRPDQLIASREVAAKIAELERRIDQFESEFADMTAKLKSHGFSLYDTHGYIGSERSFAKTADWIRITVAPRFVYNDISACMKSMVYGLELDVCGEIKVEVDSLIDGVKFDSYFPETFKSFRDLEAATAGYANFEKIFPFLGQVLPGRF